MGELMILKLFRRGSHGSSERTGGKRSKWGVVVYRLLPLRLYPRQV